MRELTTRERMQVRALTQRGIEFALVEPTKTGLKKAILDATGPIRTFLSDQNLHSYEHQSQGQDSKQFLGAYFVTQNEKRDSKASLYRPITKKGDPRIWFKGLQEFANANAIIAIVSRNGELYLLNLSRTDVHRLAESNIGPVGELVAELQTTANQVANELLAKLRALAEGGAIPSVMAKYADTAIGRTIEDALGIAMNSLAEPDYKGIEIKSSRIRKAGNKHTLFAKVADWDISELKSSSAILDRFGYHGEKDFRLYCTVSARSPNPQSLYLRLDKHSSMLDEKSTRTGCRNVVSWRLSSLQSALCEKHAETFWISATSGFNSGRETFQIRTVEHTRAPIMSQFELLLEQGEITVDHLIKRSNKGRVREGGPLFKITRKSFPLLFPPTQKYELA